MTHLPFVLLLALCAPGRAQDDLPPSPEPPETPDPYQPAEPPVFGSDVAVGYALGALLGSWPQSGPAGEVMARYDVFMHARTAPGPRVGLSLWGATTAWPRQRYVEEDSGRADSFTTTSFGAMTVVRGDPAAPVAGAAGLGFGRVDLKDYYEGPLVIPTASFEGGLRLRAGDVVFVDVLARAHWGTTRSPTAASLHEWWGAQLLLTPGLHLR